MKKLIIIIIIFATFSFITASNFGFDNSNKFGFNNIDSGESVEYGGNYSINVNNSQFLQGYTPTTLRDWMQGLFNAIYSPIAEPLSLHLNQDNWNGDEWITYTEPNFIFNESKLSTTYYNATQSESIVGTIDGGSLEDTQHQDGKYDGNTFNFSEKAGSPGLDLRINFTGIDSFNQGVMRYKTSSLSGLYPIIQMWNYDDGVWEDYPSVSESKSFATIEQPVFDYSDHVQDGVAQMRIYKASNGNTNNHYYIDWIAIAKGYGTPAGEEVDPYSWHRNSVDSGNFNTTGNVTADNFFKDTGESVAYMNYENIGDFNISEYLNIKGGFINLLNFTINTFKGTDAKNSTSDAPDIKFEAGNGGATSGTAGDIIFDAGAGATPSEYGNIIFQIDGATVFQASVLNGFQVVLPAYFSDFVSVTNLNASGKICDSVGCIGDDESFAYMNYENEGDFNVTGRINANNFTWDDSTNTLYLGKTGYGSTLYFSETAALVYSDTENNFFASTSFGVGANGKVLLSNNPSSPDYITFFESEGEDSYVKFGTNGSRYIWETNGVDKMVLTEEGNLNASGKICDSVGCIGDGVGGGDSGGWTNNSIETNTTLNVNINGGNETHVYNSTIKVKMYFDENGTFWEDYS